MVSVKLLNFFVYIILVVNPGNRELNSILTVYLEPKAGFLSFLGVGTHFRNKPFLAIFSRVYPFKKNTSKLNL